MTPDTAISIADLIASPDKENKISKLFYELRLKLSPPKKIVSTLYERQAETGGIN
jgi:hypothetical protein